MLGLTLGYLAYRTDNLFVGSVAHAANNGIIILALYYAPKYLPASQTSNLLGDGNMPLHDAALLLAWVFPLFAVVLYGFHYLTTPMQPEIRWQPEEIEELHAEEEKQ